MKSCQYIGGFLFGVFLVKLKGKKKLDLTTELILLTNQNFNL